MCEVVYNLLSSPEPLWLEDCGHGCCDRVGCVDVEEAPVKELLELCADEERVSLCEEHAREHRVLDEPTERCAVLGDEVLLVRERDELSLSACHLTLGDMDVHLIAIKVRIVCIAVTIMHANGAFILEDLHRVGHDAWLVKRGLPVHKRHVAVAEVSVDGLVPTRGCGVYSEEACSLALAGLCIEVKVNAIAVLVLNIICAGVDVRPVEDAASEALHVAGRDGLRVRQALAEVEREADLVCVNVGVRTDDRARRKVHALPHHVLAEQSLLLLQLLLDPRRRAGVPAHHELVHGLLELHEHADPVGPLSGLRLFFFFCSCCVLLCCFLLLFFFVSGVDLCESVVEEDNALVTGCVGVLATEAAELNNRPEAVGRHGDNLNKKHLRAVDRQSLHCARRIHRLEELALRGIVGPHFAQVLKDPAGRDVHSRHLLPPAPNERTRFAPLPRSLLGGRCGDVLAGVQQDLDVIAVLARPHLCPPAVGTGPLPGGRHLLEKHLDEVLPHLLQVDQLVLVRQQRHNVLLRNVDVIDDVIFTVCGEKLLGETAPEVEPTKPVEPAALALLLLCCGAVFVGVAQTLAAAAAAAAELLEDLKCLHCFVKVTLSDELERQVSAFHLM